MRGRFVVQIIVFGALLGLALPAAAGSKSKRGATRVDFDDALIKGQTNRGAVHLIERKDSNLGSLVKTRKNYRKKIVSPYGYDADSGLVGDETLEDDAANAAVKKVKKASKKSTSKTMKKRRPKKTLAKAKKTVAKAKK